MAETKGHTSVADLVLKLRTNIDSIHTTLSALTTTSSAHHAELERLSVEREKKIAELRASHETALKELATQRENDAASLVEQRRREQAELEIERQKEYEELLTKRKLEDEEREKAIQEKEAERLRALQEEDARREAEMHEMERSLHEKVERELELLEDEMEQKVAEGRQALRDLDEKRKAINAEIDAALNTPSVIPPVVFRSRSKTQKSLSNGINGTNGSNETASPVPESVISDMQTIPEVKSEKGEDSIENVETLSSDEVSSDVNRRRDIHIGEEGAHAPIANGLKTEAIVPSSIADEHINTSEESTELPISQDSTHEASEAIPEDKEVSEETSELAPANAEHETSREVLLNSHQDSASVEHANSKAQDAPELEAVMEHASALEDENSNHEAREITQESLQDAQEPTVTQIETATEPLADSTISENEDDQNSTVLPRDLDMTKDEAINEESINEESIDEESIETKPIETKSIDEEQIETKPIEEASIKPKPAESEPIEEESIEEETIPKETILEEPVLDEVVPQETVPEEATQEDTIHKEIILEETIPEDTVLEDIVLEDIVLEDTVLGEAIPEETVLKEAVLEETIQKETIFKETIPEETIPKETVLKETITEGTIHEETIHEETIHEESIPEETVLEEAVLEETIPEETIPKETVFDETVLEEAVPEEAIQEETIPKKTVFEEAVPKKTVLEEAVPEEAIQEEAIPKKTVLKETVLEEVIHEEAVPEDAIPEDAISETTIPKETVLEETITEETVSKEVIPKETTPEEVVLEEAIHEEIIRDRDVATDLAADHTDQETETTPQHHILESLSNHAVIASVEEEMIASELPSLESILEDHTATPKETVPIDLEDKSSIKTVESNKSAAVPETSSIQAEDESPEDIPRELDLDVADVPSHASQPLSEDLPGDMEDHEKAKDTLKSEPSSPEQISEEHSSPEPFDLAIQVEDHSPDHITRHLDLEAVDGPSHASQPISEDAREDFEVNGKAEDALWSEPSSPKHIYEDHLIPEPLDLGIQVEDKSPEHVSRDLDLEAINIPSHASQQISEGSPEDVEDGELAEDALRSEPSSPKHTSEEHLSPKPLDLDAPEASLDEAALVHEDPNIDQDKYLSSGEVETTDIEHITHDQSKEVPDSSIEEAIEDPSQELGLSGVIVEALEAADDREVLSDAENKSLDKSHALGDEGIDVAVSLPTEVESKIEVDVVALEHEIVDEHKVRDKAEVAPMEFLDDMALEEEILIGDKALDEDKAPGEEGIAPKGFLDGVLKVEIMGEDKAQDDQEIAPQESSDDIALEDWGLSEQKAQGDHKVAPEEISDENVTSSKVSEHVVDGEAAPESEEHHHSMQDPSEEQSFELSKSLKDENLDNPEDIAHHSVAEVDSESGLTDASHDTVLESQTDDVDLKEAAPSAIVSVPIEEAEQNATSVIEQPSSPEIKAHIDTTSEPEDGESIYDEFPQSDTEERSVINGLTDDHISTPKVEAATSSLEDVAPIHGHDSLPTVEEDPISEGLPITEGSSKPSHSASDTYQGIDQEDDTKDISSDDDFESAFSDGGSPSPRYDQVVEECLSHPGDLSVNEYLNKGDTSTKADVGKEMASEESHSHVPTALPVEELEITQDAEIPVEHSIDADSPLTKSIALDFDDVPSVTPTTSMEDDSSEIKDEANDTTPRIESFSAMPTAATETEIESEADIPLAKDSLVEEDSPLEEAPHSKEPSHTEKTPDLEIDLKSGHEEDCDLISPDKSVENEETHKEPSHEILLDHATTRGSIDLELEPSSELNHPHDDVNEAINIIETSSLNIKSKHDSTDTDAAPGDIPLSEVTHEDNDVNNATDISEASNLSIEPDNMATDSESTHDYPLSNLTHTSSHGNKAIDIIEVSNSSNEPKHGPVDMDSKVTVNYPSGDLTQEDGAVDSTIDSIEASSSNTEPKHMDADPEPPVDIISSELTHVDSDVDRAIDISEASSLSIKPNHEEVDTDPKPTANISLSELNREESDVNATMEISKTSSSSIEPKHTSLIDSETTVENSSSDLPLTGSGVVHVINIPSSSTEPKHDSINADSEPAANILLGESAHVAHTDSDVIKTTNIVEAFSSGIESKDDSIITDSEPTVDTPLENTSNAQDTQVKTASNLDLIVSDHHETQDEHDDAQEDSRGIDFDAQSLKSDDTIHANTAEGTASFPSALDEDIHKDDLADIHDHQEGARLSAFSSREVLVDHASLDHKIYANASSSVDEQASTLAADGSSSIDVFKFLEPEQHENPEAEADDTLDEGSSKDGVPLNGSTGPLDQGRDQEKALALDPHHFIAVANVVNRSAESPVTVLHTDDETETDSDSSDVTEEEESGAEAEDEEEESEEEDEETYDSEGSGSDEEEESDDPVPAPLPSKTERQFPHVIQAMPSYEFGKPMLDPFSEGSNEQFDFPSSRSSGLYSSLVSNLKSDPVVKQMGNNGGSRSPRFEDEYSPVSAATDITRAKNLVQNAFQKTDTEDDAPFHDSFSDHQPSNTHSRSYTADTISSFGAQALSDGDSTVSETPSSPFQDIPRNEPVIASVHEHAEESRDIKADLPLRAEFDPYGSNTYPKYITTKQTQDNLKAPVKSPRSSRNDRFVSQSIISPKSQYSPRGTPSPTSRRVSQANTGERPFSPETRSVSYQPKRQSQELLPSPTLKRSMTDKQLPVRGSFDPPSDSPIPTSTFFQKTRSLFEATSSQALPTVTRPLSGYFNGRGSPSPSPAPKLQKKGSMASLRSRPSSLYQHDLPVSEEELVPKSLDGDGKPPSPAWSIPTAASIARSGSVSSQRSRERKSSHGSVARVENDLNVWTPSKDIKPRSNNTFASAMGSRGERERVPLLAGEERGDGGVGVNR